MPQSSVQTVADILLTAREQRHSVPAADYTNMLSEPEHAYAVQAVVAGALGWFDTGFPQYWKSGGPNRETTLTHAPLPPAGVWQSPASAQGHDFNSLSIEAEIALRVGQNVDAATAATLDETGANTLVDAMAVSIEIVDSRWAENMSAPALLRLADLQSHGALVLDAWQPWSQRNWQQQTCRVAVGSQPIVERRGTHPLGNPLWGFGAWLRHATRNGATVPAGTVVTTGTWVGILDAHAGDKVVVEFDGIGSAQVQL